MADRTLTVTNKGEAHQSSLADTIPGSVAAGALNIVISDTTTNDDVVRGLRNALDFARREPKRVHGL